MLVSMDSMIQILKIQNKADALQYAINTTLRYKCGEGSKVDYDEAKKLFDFFCDNVTFPEDPTAQLIDSMLPFLGNIVGIPDSNSNGWVEGKPKESEAIAVVRTVDSENDVQLRLASYSKQQQKWMIWCSDEIIDNVTHYFPIRQIPH